MSSHINSFGFALRRAKRALVYILSGGQLNRKAELARIIWHRHIERPARFGYRSGDQIAWDNFLVPHLTATVGNWLKWIEEAGMEYLASFPSFYGFQLPSANVGGVQRTTRSRIPHSLWQRKVISLAVQIRWALALRVGGFAFISFLARKRPIGRDSEGVAR